MEGSMTKQKRINQKGISLETLITDTIVYLDDPACDPINAKLRLSTITRLFDEYSGLNDELATLNSDHPRLEAFRVINSNYYELAAAITKLQASNPIAHSTLNTSNITITERQDKPRLPEIEIPTFNGEQGKWVSWKHSFEELIHSRTDITDYVKWSQLINALSGPALENIIAFPPSEENYSIVWKSLCDTYDKRHFIILENFDAILEIPKLTKTNPDELSALVDKAKQHIRMLSDMKLEMNHYGEQMTKNFRTSFTTGSFEKMVLRPASVRALSRLCAIEKFRGCTSRNSGGCVNTFCCLNHVEKVYSSRFSASKDPYRAGIRS